MLMLQGSGDAKIIPDRAQGSGALMMSWGSGEAETAAQGLSHPRPFRKAQARRKLDFGFEQLTRRLCF
jgi:hypothetical protein